MNGLPKIGETVRYTGRKPGERAGGEGHEPNVVWLVGGAEGTVTSHSRGYTEHRCPDHTNAPSCICGDPDDGRVEAMPDWAVVEWAGESEGTTISKCIDTADEGDIWERVS